MSCNQPSKSPLNISITYTTNCEEKCRYNFKYRQSISVVRNNYNWLSFTYDKSSSNVKYNGNNYYVSSI